MGSGGQSPETAVSASWSHTSRPAFHWTSSPVWRTTKLVVTVGHSARASSTTAFKASPLAPRFMPSLVITQTAPASWMRSARLRAEKPAKTTLCTAPMRAQASTATASSGTHGQIERHAVALLHPAQLEHIGKAANAAVQL